MIDIWILEDELDALDIYREALGNRYKLNFFNSLSTFKRSLKDVSQPRPKLIIADLNLEDGNFLDDMIDGFSEQLHIPFVIISGLDTIDDLKKGFNLGALDYLVKPFKFNELSIKVDRYIEEIDKSDVNADKLFESELEKLTLKERKIFKLLSEAPDKKLSRQEIVEKIWTGVQVHPKTLDVHIYNLRRKIRDKNYDINFAGNGYFELKKFE